MQMIATFGSSVRWYSMAFRSFGGALDRAETRLKVYREVLDRCLAGWHPALATAKEYEQKAHDDVSYAT